MSDRITDRPSAARSSPEPDEDAPPRHAVSPWTAKNVFSIFSMSFIMGGTVAVLSLVIVSLAGITLWFPLTMTAWLCGAALGVFLAIRNVRHQVGHAFRSSDLPLPGGPGLALPPVEQRLLLPPTTHVIAERKKSLPFAFHTVYRGRISAVAISADGRLALAAGADHIVGLYEVSSGFEILVCNGFNGDVKAVAFSPDGRLAVAAGCDKKVGNKQDPDGGVRVGVVRVWDARTGQELRRFEIAGRLWSLAFLPDGRHLLVGGLDFLRLWEIDGPSPVLMVPMPSGLLAYEDVRSVAVSPDGKLAVAGCYFSHVGRLVNLDSGTELRELAGHKMSYQLFREAGVVSCAFSPDGARILTGSHDQTARVWSLTGLQLARFNGHVGRWGWRGVIGTAWLTDRLVLTASEDGRLCLWDSGTGQEMSRYHHGAGVTSLAATPDGKVALTAGRDGVVRVWRL